jgi:hypothetical protein
VPFPWRTVLVSVGAVGLLALIFRSPASSPPKRVALIGDSYAVGLGPYLASLLPDFSYEGHEGTNTSQWASHSPRCGKCGDWIAEFAPDLVLVALGVNDGTNPNPANYQDIVRTLHGLGSRVVWIEPPAAVNTASRSIIASLGVPTVPATQTPLAADRLHPKTYSTWAQEISQKVAEG